MPDLSDLGWNEALQIKYKTFPFPAEVEEILFDYKYDTFYGDEEG